MQLLPPVKAGPFVCQLPLADPSAAALAEALLAGAVERPELLRDALAEDAALTLWAIIRASQLDGRQPDTIADVADWLSQRCHEAFDWPRGQVAAASEPSTAAKRQWADLTARSVAVALGATELGEREIKGDRRHAYLLGLLHAAGEWLQSGGGGEAAAAIAYLPGRLAARLSRLGSVSMDEPDEDPVLQVVAEAVLVLGDRRRKPRHREFDTDRLRSLGDRAARRWTNAVPGAGRCLPALIGRLAELKRLSTDFHDELQRQKLAALRAFAYGAGHEINNPLANIATRAQTLLRNETDPERRRALATINSQVFRAHEMITDVMLFARPPQLAPEPTDLVALIDTVLGELKPMADEQGTELERIVDDETVTIGADKDQLATALKAMCVNSLEAIGHGGRVVVELKRAVDESSGCVQMVVRDTGPGIPPDVREHIFDPFFSGREAGRGLGFGLSKSWRIVTDHGGRIDVAGHEGQGATFVITLPEKPPDGESTD
jgi:signal transduction histidine kinase